MDTKIIVDEKGTGKTTKAIKESAKTGKYIITLNRHMVMHTFNMAKEMGLNIPFPITIDEWMRGEVSHTIRRQGVIVDEGLILLETLLVAKVDMVTITK